jgi:glycosyltransferase involved in cell wall biosynthesis
MKKKPVVLVFIPNYLPGYRAGGPIRSLVNMVARLGDELDFRIITRDRDLNDDEAYPGIIRGEWIVVGKAKVMYLRQASISVNYLSELVHQLSPDVIYLNSYFNSIFTQRILWARKLKKIHEIPIVLAPRGEFSSGALGLNKLKKSIYLNVVRILGIYDDIVWHASSDIEAADIISGTNHVKISQIKVALNLAPVEPGLELVRAQHIAGKPLRVCFLSRISPKKNLDFSLRVLTKVEVPVVYTIYGPKEDKNYWRECELLLDALPPHVTVEYGGIIVPDRVKSVLLNHDLFFFPTLGENYGHVIHEALCAGLPVLLSDQTPWDAVNDSGVGWTLPLTAPMSFVSVIEDVAGWSNEALNNVSNLAQKFANDCAIDTDVEKANLDLFMQAVNTTNKELSFEE